MIEGVLLTSLRVIDAPGGAVRHGLRAHDPGYVGFAEVYFSSIDYGVIKAWKRHRRVTLNIVVPKGKIMFVIYDDRPDSSTRGAFEEIVLSDRKAYKRLTVPPGLWMAFEGLADGSSLLMNLIDEPHDPEEADVVVLDAIPYEGWRNR